MLCARHARRPEGRQLEAAIGRIARRLEQTYGAGDVENRPGEVVLRQERALAAFARRVEQGEFGNLIDGELQEGLAQTAVERALAIEIGALRVVMVRLLTDPTLAASSQARRMARVAELIIRAVQTQGALAAGAELPGWKAVWESVAELGLVDDEGMMASVAATREPMKVGTESRLPESDASGADGG